MTNFAKDAKLPPFAKLAASLYELLVFFLYRNDPYFSDRMVWANSTDPDQTAHRDQTAPRGAGSSLFAIPLAPF